MSRGFKIVSTYKDKNIELPVRSTKNSAGYDFASATDVVVDPGQITLIPTGIKSYMNDQEYLMLVARSSLPRKVGLVIPNSMGIIDADYFDNEDNEGEIFIQVLNITDKEVRVEKGQRIAQGIFMPYLIADGDDATGVRSGGFGSTDKK